MKQQKKHMLKTGSYEILGLERAHVGHLSAMGPF